MWFFDLDFTGGLRASLKKEYGVELSAEDITQWDLHPLLDPIVGRSWWAWMRERDWLWANFPVIDGAIGGLDTLRRQGHYLELVTSKPRWAEANVWKFLGKWRPAFNRVTILNDPIRKVDVTDAAVLIDDKLDNCVEFAQEGRRAIMFARPHNKPTMLPPGIERIDGWQAVVRALNEEREMC